MNRPLRFQTQKVAGDLHRAVNYINSTGLAAFVHSFHQVGEYTVVIWQFTDHPGYRHWCEKMGEPPLTVEQFFRGK